MFGYVCNEIFELMLLLISLVYRLLCCLVEVCYNGILGYLFFDGKIQVSVVYENDKFVLIDMILIFIQYIVEVDGISDEQGICECIIEDFWIYVVELVIVDLVFKFFCEVIKYLVNFIGKFVVGGFQGDVGFIGCKIIVDIYGGYVCYGGGVFFGKDFIKVDCLVVYVVCYVVKCFVVVGFVEWVEVQLSYVIGVVQFVLILVEFFGISVFVNDVFIVLVQEYFDLCFGVIIEIFGLCNFFQ